MSLNIPKKISELPSTISLAPTDLFVRVGDGGVTSKLTLLKLQDYLETSDTFVTGGTFNTVTDNIDFVGTNSFPPFSVSLSSLSPSSNVGNLIFVDSVYGNDSSGKLNDFGKPFSTYTAASVSATTNDLIVIRPGTYDEKIILKDGVKIYAYPNVTFVGSYDTIITDDNVGVNAEIYGYMDINATCNSGSTNAIYIQNTGTTLNMECGDIIVTGTSNSRCIFNYSNQEVKIKAKDINSFTDNSSETIRLEGNVSGNSTTIECNNVIGRSACILINKLSNGNIKVLNDIILKDTTSGIQSAIYHNGSGDIFIKANKIKTTTYRAVNSDLVTANGNLYVDVDLIESTNSTLVAANNIYRSLISNFGSSANTYIKAKNMIADGGLIYISVGTGVGRKTVLEGNMYSKQNLLIRNSSTRKLIVKNSTLKRGGDTDNNIVVGMGNYLISNIFLGIYDGLSAEFNNVNIVKEETLSGTSTNPIFGLDGTTSEVYIKNCDVYGENIFSGATAFNAGSLADGNIYFKNTTSNVDKGVNVNDISVNSGFTFDTNFKIIE
jgi:hypothetical protein